VVYDLERHEAHCLNRTAAFVFKQCDGRTSVREIARRLRAEFEAPADEDLVWQALDQLDGARLLRHKPSPPPGRGFSRRAVVRRVGLGLTVLLPVVTSILVPTPAEAAATCVDDSACAGNPGSPCYVSSSALCDGTCTCRSAPAPCGTSCCDLTNQDCSF
jgi:hypothetical protein